MSLKLIPINVKQLRSACSACSLQELCLPAGLGPQEMERLERLINRRRPLKRGEYLYRAGSALQWLV